jgi:hypothetical protein
MPAGMLRCNCIVLPNQTSVASSPLRAALERIERLLDGLPVMAHG